MNNLSDIFNLIKVISFRRLWNLIKLLIQYLSIKIGIRGLNISKPYSFTIEPTNYCNLKCPECPTGMNALKRMKGYLDFDLFRKIIDNSNSFRFYIMLYFQGEPLLNNDFFKFVEYAKSKKNYIVTSTNAQLLTLENCEKIVKSGLDKIIISMDGMSQDAYSSYRINGDITKVQNAIKYLLDAKSKLKSTTPYIIIQYLVLGTNENEMQKAKEFAKKLKVKLQFKSAQIKDFINNNHLIPENLKYSRFIKENNHYSLKNANRKVCSRLLNTSVITWDGNVLPCCFDKDAKYSFGNINESSFEDIWNNEKRNKFLTKLNCDICRECYY